MTSWLRSTEAGWQRTHSTCAAIVTGIVSRRWRRPASLYRHESSTSNCNRPPLWAHTMGRTMGRHIPACSETWLALGLGQWRLSQTACVQKTARTERNYNSRLLRDFHLVLPFKLWIHDWPKFTYSYGSHAKRNTGIVTKEFSFTGITVS